MADRKRDLQGSMTPRDVVDRWLTDLPVLVPDRMFKEESLSPQGDILRQAGVPFHVIRIMDKQTADLLTASILDIPVLQSVMLRTVARRSSRWVDHEQIVDVFRRPEKFMRPNGPLVMSFSRMLGGYNASEWRAAKINSHKVPESRRSRGQDIRTQLMSMGLRNSAEIQEITEMLYDTAYAHALASGVEDNPQERFDRRLNTDEATIEAQLLARTFQGAALDLLTYTPENFDPLRLSWFPVSGTNQEMPTTVEYLQSHPYIAKLK